MLRDRSRGYCDKYLRFTVFDAKPQHSFEHAQQSPASFRHDMLTQQSSRDVTNIVGAVTSTDHPSSQAQTVRKLSAIAERALNRRADLFATSGFVEHPCTILKGWTMTHVLVMQTRQLGNPGAEIVAVKTNDGADHADLMKPDRFGDDTLSEPSGRAPLPRSPARRA
jgi:hypothetical protein